MVNQIDIKNINYVIEIGPGTGELTEILFNSGIPYEKVFIIEKNKNFIDFLKKKFPKANIIYGSVEDLDLLLDEKYKNKIDYIISGIPITLLNEKQHQIIMNNIFNFLKSDGKFIQFTYSLLQPIKKLSNNFNYKCSGFTLLNFPPAFVWTYKRKI